MHLAPEVAVRLLSQAVARITDPEHRRDLWRERDTGAATAQVPAGVWARSEQAIRNNPATLAAFVGTLEDLSRSGIPLAAQPRDRI